MLKSWFYCDKPFDSHSDTLHLSKVSSLHYVLCEIVPELILFIWRNPALRQASGPPLCYATRHYVRVRGLDGEPCKLPQGTHTLRQLQRTATHCNTFVAKLQHFCSPSSNTTRYTHTHGYNGNVLQHTATGDGKHHLIMATYCNTLSQCVAVLQHTVAVCCSTLPL